MSDFTPIDHKDSDPEYRDHVRKEIESTLDTTLTDASAEALIGDWDHTLTTSTAPSPAHERSSSGMVMAACCAYSPGPSSDDATPGPAPVTQLCRSAGRRGK